ncbi:MAG: AraC family transcriptional regulator N-terminal domain-containing protein [Spirochaetia bacterium]
MPENLERLEYTSQILRNKLKMILPHTEIRITSIPGFTIVRRDENPNQVLKVLYKPLSVSILDGYKESIFGREKLVYGKNQTMVTGVDILCSSRIGGATKEKPYLALGIEFNYMIIADLLQEFDLNLKGDLIQPSMAVTDSDVHILDAYSRLIDLLDMNEAQQKILAPMIMREIHFRLLTGPLGSQICMLHTSGCVSNRIAKALRWIREHFSENFKVEDIAAQVHMAPSSFYRNFNKVTTMSPIQYQKQLRLYEARRLIIAGEDVVNAAYRVGYESATQFHKEYKRMFGAPPKADIKSLLT